MKNAIFLAIAVVVIGGAVYFSQQSGGSEQTTSSASTIQMGDDGYEPSNITIREGSVVTFENVGAENKWPASNIHPTHEIYSEFDPRRPITPGESWAFRFDKAGIWRWHDHLKPTLIGTITVE